MPRRQKFKDVMSVIERRIRQGDYVLHPIPGERKIAEETGVSHMTARKAVSGLLERKVLIRRPNGSLDIYPGHHGDASTAHFLLLYPAYASTYLTHLRQTVADAAEQYGLSMRPVQYVHWDDPVVASAASNPAGLIFISSAVAVPGYVLAMLRSSKCISLDLDLSEQGIPSIRLFPDSHVFKVFDHLRQLGHQQIDCISTQHDNPEIQRRIQLWRQWLARHQLTGELLQRPSQSFEDATPAAYDLMREWLGSNGINGKAPEVHPGLQNRGIGAGKSDLPSSNTADVHPGLRAGGSIDRAFVGTTFPAAVGAMRACWENGLTAGKDVSICAINIEAPARFMTPSVTGLDTPKLSRLLSQCFDYLASDKPWAGPLRLEPARAEFFPGESTGPIASSC